MTPFNLPGASPPGGSGAMVWGVAVATDAAKFLAARTGRFIDFVARPTANTLTTASTTVRLSNLTQATSVTVVIPPGSVALAGPAASLSANQGDVMLLERIVDAGGAGTISNVHGGFRLVA